MAVTPDGAQIITGGGDGRVLVWDGASGTQVAELAGHRGGVTAVAMTPDGTQIITGEVDGRVLVWDRASGTQIAELAGHISTVQAMAVTPDGWQIVSVGDTTIRIWDRLTGEQIAGTGFGVPARSAPLVQMSSDTASDQDLLDITPDVQMVAALAAAVSTDPPLSIALLGDWGTGKSSFMRQMHDRITRLAALSRNNPGLSLFAANVRQVEFNAWHYSDEQVWVGLIEHLFHTLADTPTTTTTGSTASDSIPTAAARVRAEQARLTARLEEEKSRRDRLRRAGGDAGSGPARWSRLPAIVGLWTRYVLADLAQVLARTAARHRRGFVTAIAVVAVVAVAAVWARPVFGVVATTIAGVIAAAVALAAPVSVTVTAVAGVVKKAAKPAEWVRAQTQRRATVLEEAIRADEAALREIDAARRLGDYLTELRSPQRYETYRGLVGRIHADLTQLSNTLAAARAEWTLRGSVGPPPLQRIVLYVDDLDRCPPEKVIDVLRAVHLLLALPLFVVVVAVDPRWLRHALHQHHTALFLDGSEDQPNGPPAPPYGISRGRSPASSRPHDAPSPSPTNYLDKIFQVPFALRPLGDHAENYLRDLLPASAPAAVVVRSDPAASARDDATITTPPSPPPPALLPPPISPPLAAAPAAQDDLRSGGGEIERPERAEGASRRGGDQGVGGESGMVQVRLVDDLRPSGLQLGDAERDFLPRLGPLLPTPRAAKRLVNLYRLLRIGIPDHELTAFLGTGDGGPYQAAALLLATLTGYPDTGRAVLTGLRSAAPSTTNTPSSTAAVGDIVEHLRAGHPDPRAGVLADLIEAIGKDVAVHRDLSNYQRWGHTIARFSFETYDLFLRP